MSRLKNTNKKKLISNFLEDLDQQSVDLGLKRITKALKAINSPSEKIPAIQVAGTNGKGSIACFIHMALIQSGIKTGLTTSPHLINWSERIRINNILIPETEFNLRLKELNSTAKQFHLTTFEKVVAIALQHFEANNVDLILLEVGLGGRLDATTAHKWRPIIAMGSIGLDHCEYLGNSLEKIAEQKAAVITKNSTVISTRQHPSVEKILIATAKYKNASINWVEPLDSSWKLGLNGQIQRENAAVARGVLMALKTIGWEISSQKMREGFAKAHWPGRLQKATWRGRPLLLDGAHNPHAAIQLSKERMTWSKQSSGVNWILGIQKNKDGPNILRALIKTNDCVWLVPVPGYISWSKQNILQYCPEFSLQIYDSDSVLTVLSLLSQKEQWPVPAPLISGSLYLIGHLMKSRVIEIDPP